MAKFCRNCGSPLTEGAKFCPECGQKLIVEQKVQPSVCKKCGAALTPGKKFCGQCGTPVTGETTPAKAPETQPETQPGQESAQPSTPQPEQKPARSPEAPPTQKPALTSGPANKTEEFLAQKRRENAAGTAGAAGAVGPAGAAGKAAKKAEYVEPQKSGAPKKSKKGIVILVALLLVAAFLIAAFAWPGFLREEGGGGGWSNTTNAGKNTSTPAPDLKVLKTENKTITKDSPTATLCGVKVDVVPETLGSQSKKLTVSKLEDTAQSGVKSENYELEMGAHEKFAVPVEVTFPCTVKSGYDVTVEHYNSEAGAWEPLISFVDEAKGTVTAYFGSFSPARVSYLPVGKNPGIFYTVTDPNNPNIQRIEVSRNYWKILERINPDQYTGEITKFIDDPSNYAVDFPKLDPKKMDGELAYQAFMNSNTIWSFVDPMINLGIETLPFSSQSKVVQFMIDHSGKLGNAMNAIPFVMMTAQLVHDLKDFGKETLNSAAVNLYKNLITSGGTIYSLATGYSEICFTLAFFGVALFGMELDYFVDAAKAAQTENVAAVFDSYYTNIAPFDSYHWYEVFHDAYWKNEGNADKAMKALKDAVDVYCNEFWKVYEENGDDLWFATTEARYKNIFMNASPELRGSLTEQQKQKVWKLIEEHSMKIIQRFLFDELQTKTRKHLASMTEMYNKELTFTVTETVEGNGYAVMTGKTFCFGADGKPVPGWHVTVPEDDEYSRGWSTDFACTTLGYMKMGMPWHLYAYDDEDDYRAGEEPDFDKDFETVMEGTYHTLIEFITANGESVSGSYTGYTWDGTDYGGAVYSAYINKAMQNALRSMTFKPDSKGNFKVSGSGKVSDSSSDGTDSESYSVSATIDLKGNINLKTGSGTYEMTATVQYYRKWHNDFTGTDVSEGTITFKSSGEISGIVGEYDPSFSGDGTYTLGLRLSHEKGTRYGDENSTNTLSKTVESYFSMKFLGQ